jgi:hypothetical protein
MQSIDLSNDSFSLRSDDIDTSGFGDDNDNEEISFYSRIDDADDDDNEEWVVNEHASCQRRSCIEIAPAYAVADTFASLS